MDDKLKPCPFCGKAVSLPYKVCQDAYAIRCDSCLFDRMGVSVESVAEKWNTRQSPHSMNEWISVEDELPKEGDYICALYKEDETHELHYDADRKKWYWDYSGHVRQWENEAVSVTHWMPRPTPPTEDEGGKK